MSDTGAETTPERKPPTLADIVREKTDDGRLIIDFFLDVMEGRIEGAELCHRMDAARQLVKYGSKDAAKFIARYRGVPCGHPASRSPGQADPCSAADATGRVSAPGPFTQDFLTVLSAVDEDLMARLVRSQTADGFTVVEFLDDVMQDRNDGFKPHHRIAAAKELIVHIVRDEQPEPLPAEAPASASAEAPSSVHPEPGSPELSRRVEGARPEPVVVPAQAGTHPTFPEPVEGPEPNSTVVPAQEPAPEQSGAGTHPLNPEPVLSTVEGPLTSVHPEPGSPELGRRVEGPVLSTAEEPVLSLPKGPADGSSIVPAKEPAEVRQDYEERKPLRRRTRKQRRQHGAARAATLGKHPTSERSNKEEKQDKPTPVELTPAERRIKERLEQHWHEPGPWDGPIDSAYPGRSPPW